MYTKHNFEIFQTLSWIIPLIILDKLCMTVLPDLNNLSMQRCVARHIVATRLRRLTLRSLASKSVDLGPGAGDGPPGCQVGWGQVDSGRD